MYSLTDFTRDELRLMAEMIQSRLNHEEACARINRDYGNDDVTLTLAARYNATITNLKEMNVRVLTALQIVRDREKVQSN